MLKEEENELQFLSDNSPIQKYNNNNKNG